MTAPASEADDSRSKWLWRESLDHAERQTASTAGFNHRVQRDTAYAPH